MEENQVLRSMVRDDAYRVMRVLAEGPAGKTELVTLGGSELLVRKRIPSALANASAWATLMGMKEPRLPHIEEMYEMPDELVVVYSYVQGRSVAELVADEGRQAPATAVAIVAQTCHAAAALHAAGLVHRDITPGNVIVADDGAHLVDLGIARRQRSDGARDTSVLGTWGFAAPEQFGFAQTDQRSDVYALGRLLGFLLTGVRPDDESYERLLADATVVPAALASVVARATMFEPSARYQSTQAMQEALEVALNAPAEAVATRQTPPSPAGRARQESDAPWTPAVTAPYQSARPAASQASPRAAKWEWVVGVVVWLTMAFCALVVVLATRDAILTGDPPWVPAHYGMSVVTFCSIAALSYEVYQALRRKGLYRNTAHPVGRSIIEVCKILLIYLILLILCAFVLPSRFN